MRKIKVEYLWHTLEEKNMGPSPLFTRELSRQITPQLLLLLDSTLKIDPARIICFSISELQSYSSFIFFYGINEMEVWISSLSDAFLLCPIIVRWHTSDNRKVYPWEDIQGDALTFDLSIGRSQLQQLNSLLPQIYSPVIKAKESGLPYDYQVYYAQEGTLSLSPKTAFTPEDIAAIDRLSKTFFNQWNASHEIKLPCIGPVKGTKAKIRIPVDGGGCPQKAIEALIACFREQQSIKRITFR